MNKKILIAGGAAAVLLTGIIVYSLRSSPDEQPGSEYRARKVLGMGPNDGIREAAAASGTVDYNTLIKDTRLLLQYPKNSFPLRPGASDLIEFHKVTIPASPLYEETKGKEPRELPVVCGMQPDANIVPEGALLKARLTCSRTTGDKTAVKVKLTKIRLERLTPTKAGTFKIKGLPAPRVESPDGKGLVITYKPTRSDWGRMILKTEFQVTLNGGVHRAKRGTYFFSSPRAPARFTGNISDALVDGSLEVKVEVRTIMPGRYTIEANLFQESGEPVGYAYNEVRLKTGLNQVKLKYFGRIFHKQGSEGVYVLRGLRGTQHTDLDPALLTQSPEKVAALLKKDRPAMPDRRIIPPYAGKYETARYETRDFSFKEYDGPDKRERLRMLEQLAAKQ